MICKIRMVLAAPGPLLTPPSSSPPRRPLTGSTPPKLRSAMETQPSGGRPQQAESGHGRPGRAPSQHRRPTTTPATARLAFRLRHTGHPPSHPPTIRVLRHAGLGFSVLCLLRTNWSTGERLCGGDANALAEELEPLWLITLLLRVPEAFGCYISPHSARSACRLTALVRTNLRCRVRVRVRSEMEACVDLRGHGVVLGVHESI